MGKTGSKFLGLRIWLTVHWWGLLRAEQPRPWGRGRRGRRRRWRRGWRRSSTPPSLLSSPSLQNRSGPQPTSGLTRPPDTSATGWVRLLSSVNSWSDNYSAADCTQWVIIFHISAISSHCRHLPRWPPHWKSAAVVPSSPCSALPALICRRGAAVAINSQSNPCLLSNSVGEHSSKNRNPTLHRRGKNWNKKKFQSSVPTAQPKLLLKYICFHLTQICQAI